MMETVPITAYENTVWQVTGADIYILYSNSWLVQTVIKHINKNKISLHMETWE